jgi:hypothetical protein
VGGTSLYAPAQRMSRQEALRLYTQGSAWFSGEERDKGLIAEGWLADLAVLSADYFSVPEEDISGIESVLTLVDGKIVHGSGGFGALAPPLPPVSPSWSPVTLPPGGGHAARHAHPHVHAHGPAHAHGHPATAFGPWNSGCDCFVF